jgi:PAS domain S-box-containing protein
LVLLSTSTTDLKPSSATSEISTDRWIPDIVVTTDLEDHIIHWNSAAERLSNIPSQLAIGQCLRDLTPFEYEGVTRDESYKMLREKGLWEGEVGHVSNDGKKSYLICSIRYMRDSSRRITGIMLRLQHRSQQMAGILDSITDGVFVLDQDFRVTLWNREAERITGLLRDQMIGQDIRERPHDLVDVETLGSINIAFKKKMTVTVEQYNERADRWLEMSLYPSEQGIFAYFKDVSIRKKKEASLKDELNKQKLIARAMIDAHEKERAEIGRELHDNINQLLSTTKLYLELAKNDDNARLSLISRSAGNIHYAIREIRNISRSLVPPSIGDLGLQDSVADLVESIRTTSTINIEFYPIGNVDRRLNDDSRLMLFRVIQEQVDNVLKHSGARNLIIELGLEEMENRIELSITDDGRGFDPEQADGNGLGLSNIRNKADLFGGRVHVRSAPGQGCILRVQVPASHNS